MDVLHGIGPILQILTNYNFLEIRLKLVNSCSINVNTKRLQILNVSLKYIKSMHFSEVPVLGKYEPTHMQADTHSSSLEC